MFWCKEKIIVVSQLLLFLCYVSPVFSSGTIIGCSYNDRAVLAVAKVSPSRGKVPLKVSLDFAGSRFGESTCAHKEYRGTYTWKSSDGQIVNGIPLEDAQFIYDEPGIYQITLTVKNQYGYSDSTTLSVTALSNEVTDRDILSFTMAPLIKGATVTTWEDSSKNFVDTSIDVATYSDKDDIEFMILIYDSKGKILPKMKDNSWLDADSTGGGHVGDIKQNLITVNAEIEISASSKPHSIRLFAKNKALCDKFGASTEAACGSYSVFIPYVDNLSNVYLKVGDMRRLYIEE